MASAIAVTEMAHATPAEITVLEGRFLLLIIRMGQLTLKPNFAAWRPSLQPIPHLLSLHFPGLFWLLTSPLLNANGPSAPFHGVLFSCLLSSHLRSSWASFPMEAQGLCDVILIWLMDSSVLCNTYYLNFIRPIESSQVSVLAR